MTPVMLSNLADQLYQWSEIIQPMISDVSARLYKLTKTKQKNSF